VIVKRQTPPKSKKTKKPAVSKNPKVFEDAFEKSLGQHPVDYLTEKLQGGSSLSSVEYLFDILSADIAMKNNCICKGFDYYYMIAQERMKAMKKRTVHNKLVRDRIPEIIEASGRTCVAVTLPDDAYIRALDAKLNEELAEYQQSKSLEELADLLEVMGAVVKARGYTWDDLTRVRKEKRAARGAFDQRIFLKEVIE
jgi:predicted house-cleaning noncanonical NTP pyrophosphatase (MazG superfamily)